VTCPPGFAPGAAFVVQDPSTGQQMQAVVPDGITPGQTFQMQVPSSVPAPVPMAQPYVEQQYAPQPQRYAPQPRQLEMNMLPRPQAPIIINNNNNDNDNNTMQAPTPQQMYTHEPRTDWQSGLFECFNDFPVCLGVWCCFPCAYGMLVDMHMENKAEGRMPFGNFGACWAMTCLHCVGPASVICILPIYLSLAYSPYYFSSGLFFVFLPLITGGGNYSAIWGFTSVTRTSIRNKLNLKAEPCDDLIVHFCCMACAVCQEYRELKATHGGSMGRNHFNRL